MDDINLVGNEETCSTSEEGNLADTDGSGNVGPVTVDIQHPSPQSSGSMFERAKDKWAAQTRDSKRVIIAIVVLSLIASVVVIATVSKSASLKSPKSEPVWENIRLPDFIRPISYDVKLKINMTGEFFTGVEDVFVNITKATSVILIHTSSAESFDKVANKTAKEMKVESFKIVQYSMESKKEGSDIKVKHAYAWSQNDFFVMKLKSTIEQGIYKLTFTWRSRLVRGLDGIYISSYKENGIEKKMLASQMEPLAARKVMPCFDEPDFKAKFTMEITSEDSYGLVLWNMPQIGDAVPVKGGEKWSTRKFKESVPMSTYLLAFVVADFKCTDIMETGKGVKVRTCGRSEAIIDKKSGDYSNKINKVIIERYEEFYGENFPLPKIDSVAIPDFSAGAMENWGLILYRETALLYDPNYDTLNNKARVNTVVSHELAHQWFGNLVTMKWWNDLWLNEGFASYVEWLGTDASQPDWNYLDFQTYSDRSRAFGIDAYSSSRPTSIGVEKPADITAQFDSISYAKGSALLVQAKMFMGGKPSKDFEKSIQNYVKRYKFSNTVQDDLYREMSKVYAAKDDMDKYADKSVNISDVMNTWTLQMNFPVVSVQQYDEGHVILSSKRFLISESGLEGDKRSPYGYQWFVPVEYTIDNNDKEFKWIKPHSKLLVPFNFTKNNSYMHINKESAGYYITDYSHDLFGRLLKQLKTDTSNFTISERQGLLYETFTLVSGGYKPMNMALELLKAILDGEKSLVPLREISRQLSRVLTHIREDDALAKNWKFEWKPRMEMLFKVHGADYFKTDKMKEKVLPVGDVNFQKRLLITFAVSLGCSYGVQDCVDAAKVKFTAYKSDAKANPLPSDFRGTVLNTAMSVDTVTEEEWDFLWSQYQESDSQSEKQTMYYALGLIQKESVLKKFSEMCLNESLVRSSDALYIMGRSISQTYLGAKVSLDFMLNKWDYISKDFTNGLFAVDSYISGVLSKFANQPTLERIEKFFSTKERQESLGAGLASYKSSIQSIKSNIGWLEKHLESVKKFVG